MEQICKAFGITMGDFFAEGNMVDVTPGTKKLYDKWCSLTKDSQRTVEDLMDKLP